MAGYKKVAIHYKQPATLYESSEAPKLSSVTLYKRVESLYSWLEHAERILAMSTSILDYVPLAEKVLSHWQQVETQNNAPLVLKDKTTLTQFTELKDRLIAVQAENLTQQNARQRAQLARDSAIDALHLLVKQARTSLKAEDVSAVLPALLPPGSAPPKYLQAARDIAEVWESVNASGTALTIPLRKGEATVQVSHAAFVAAITAYESAVRTLTQTQSAEAVGKKTRDSVHKTAHAKLLAYALAAKARLPEGDPLRDTIPLLSDE